MLGFLGLGCWLGFGVGYCGGGVYYWQWLFCRFGGVEDVVLGLGKCWLILTWSVGLVGCGFRNWWV